MAVPAGPHHEPAGPRAGYYLHTAGSVSRLVQLPTAAIGLVAAVQEYRSARIEKPATWMRMVAVPVKVISPDAAARHVCRLGSAQTTADPV